MTASRVEIRGPKLGDAVSLWNFTPSPGWTVEETRTLRLLLMRYGIGRWVQILATGLLPGKLIQQLYGATQRLLGQQSLAAFTGLRIDLDRVRAENEGRTDAPRKSGLIIYDGPVLTREDKDRLQAEAQERYGLTPEQMARAEAEVAALQDSMQGTAPAWRDCPLLAGDTSSWGDVGLLVGQRKRVTGAPAVALALAGEVLCDALLFHPGTQVWSGPA